MIPVFVTDFLGIEFLKRFGKLQITNDVSSRNNDNCDKLLLFWLLKISISSFRWYISSTRFNCVIENKRQSHYVTSCYRFDYYCVNVLSEIRLYDSSHYIFLFAANYSKTYLPLAETNNRRMLPTLL